MYGMPYIDIDYYKYGIPYRKRTQLWNNVMNWKPIPSCKKDCDSMNGKRHIAESQQMPSGKKQDWGNQPLFGLTDLYVIPPSLIHEIFNSITI